MKKGKEGGKQRREKVEGKKRGGKRKGRTNLTCGPQGDFWKNYQRSAPIKLVQLLRER